MLILPIKQIIKTPSIIIPNEYSINFKKFIRGDLYSYYKELETNKQLGKRGYKIIFYDRNICKTPFEISFFSYRWFYFDEENDALDFWQEIHTPGFDPREYNIDPDCYTNTICNCASRICFPFSEKL